MGCKGIKLRTGAETRGHPGQQVAAERKRRRAAEKALALQVVAAQVGVLPIKVRQQGQREVDEIKANQAKHFSRFLANNPGHLRHHYYR